ncbi:MAG: hypothetical protein A2W95_03060 [Bacteroidetes bacterium GWA2_40_14]|nr:MAG: hypothetical protein A2W95_03060 [Bacteroidetes bacterium GWA2_40_14]OFZ26034.1 MAG: hypothetical protein A2437_10665 [Bacteroidetes bacterium RIFOXYC2_FULL_40_12]
MKFLVSFEQLIAGSPLKFDVEKRLFNIAVFISIIVSGISLIINANLDLPQVLQVIIGIGSVFLVYIYVNSRILRQFFVWTYIFAALFILSGSWLLNEGPNGSINYLYILAFVIFLSITNRKKHLVISALIIINLIVLYAIYYAAPQFVYPYPSVAIKNADLLFTFTYVVLFSALIFSALRMNFENEKTQVEKQKQELELQHKHITDSIQYAKEIQQGMLQHTDSFKLHFPQSFIYWQPKDVVSGDFYFFKEYGANKEKIICGVADCTGHGVPGALITILGLASINDIILQFPDLSAGEILDQLRIKIKSALQQGRRSVENRDGMDMAICIVDKNNNILQYAGANRPLYIVRSDEMIELKPNRMPIGVHYFDGKPFLNQNIHLYIGDIIYLFTDGFSDQFGAEENRKFFLSNFKKLLLDNSHLLLDEQCQIIKKTFKSWKDTNEQTDDILIMGFRV